MAEILLVEDEESVNRGIEFTLTKEGYHVETAGTIHEAEEILKRMSPQMVICDVNLPDGSGLDLIREIRKSSMVHIICLTALDTEIDQVACVPQIDTMHPTCVIGCISNLHIKLMVLLLQLTGAFLMAKEKHIFPSVGAMCFRWHPSVQEGFAFAYLSGYSILKRVSVALRSIALLHPRQRTEPV